MMGVRSVATLENSHSGIPHSVCVCLFFLIFKLKLRVFVYFLKEV